MDGEKAIGQHEVEFVMGLLRNIACGRIGTNTPTTDVIPSGHRVSDWR